MPKGKPVALYRCAKCKHRVEQTQAQCLHCKWTVDLALAREEAELYQRKRSRRRSPHERADYSRRLLIVAGLVLFCLVLLFVLHVVNSF
jgi:hypothetical protein